jgi:hypothetical protein
MSSLRGVKLPETRRADPIIDESVDPAGELNRFVEGAELTQCGDQ